MQLAIVAVYMIAGYIAAGYLEIDNLILSLAGYNGRFITKFMLVLVFGWVLIPIAIIKAIIVKLITDKRAERANRARRMREGDDSGDEPQ